jgi:DUF971 family protein
MTPLQLKFTEERDALTVTWNDGCVTRIPVPVLRARSRAAQQVRADIDSISGSFDGVTVTSAEAIGSYAVRLVFSDGHDRGIYPWSYLREIADSYLCVSSSPNRKPLSGDTQQA